MNYKKFISLTFIFITLTANAFSFEIQQNDLRIFAATQNDKFAFGISQNKDDQLTATAELHFIFPYFFIDINDNSITKRFRLCYR